MKPANEEGFLTQRRKHTKLSQKDLSERIGVNINTIGRWEAKGIPSANKLIALCEAIGITPCELFKGKKCHSRTCQFDDIASSHGEQTEKTQEQAEAQEFLPKPAPSVYDRDLSLVALQKCEKSNGLSLNLVIWANFIKKHHRLLLCWTLSLFLLLVVDRSQNETVKDVSVVLSLCAGVATYFHITLHYVEKWSCARTKIF